MRVSKLIRNSIVCVIGLTLYTGTASATFHFMQIEQVIGGVNGDTTAQAIQLRMRSAGQNLVGQGRLVVRNAAGASPVTIVDMTTNVPNGQSGRRVLVASAGFLNKTTPATVADFPMTNLIPASYLNAGTLTFEDDFGTVYWRLSWGGASYTGSGSGSIANDPDGNFNPPFANPLPASTNMALQFTGPANATSTNNNAQYVVTQAAAVFTNNANAAFTVMAQPMGACCLAIGGCTATTQAGCVGDYLGDGTICTSPGCVTPIAIVESTPPNNAIDARQPSSLTMGCMDSPGFDSVLLTFDGDAEDVDVDDFELSTVPQGGEPIIAAVQPDGMTAELFFETAIPVGYWTVITHITSGTSVRLGFLPGDVNNDRTASPVDILKLIDHLNGVESYAAYQTDIDRSGVTNPADILRVIDLLNGADCFDAYNGQTLPQ